MSYIERKKSPPLLTGSEQRYRVNGRWVSFDIAEGCYTQWGKYETPRDKRIRQVGESIIMRLVDPLAIIMNIHETREQALKFSPSSL